MLVLERKPRTLIEDTIYFYIPGFKKPMKLVLMPHGYGGESVRVAIDCDPSIKVLRAEHVDYVTELPRTPGKWPMPQQKERLFSGTLEQCLDFVRDSQLRHPERHVEVRNESFQSSVWGERLPPEKELRT